MPRSRQLYTALVIFALAGLTVHARVFWRWGGRGDTTHTLKTLGGTQAYSAPVTVNGGQGQLDVFSFDTPFPTTLRAVGKALGLSFGDPAGRSMAVQTITTAGSRVRLVMVAPPDVTRTLVFALQQSPDQVRRSQTGPDPAALPHVPVYPGSTPLFSASDQKAHAELALSATTAPPQAVHRFYAAQLDAAGWMPAIAGAKATTGGIYLRGRSVCCVQASSQDRQTHIAILYKELTTQPEE
jgi:hypothetical protein